MIEKEKGVISSVQKGIEEEMSIQKNGKSYVVSVWDGKSRYANGRKKYHREEVDNKKIAVKREQELLKAIKEIKADIEVLKPKQVNKNSRLFSVAANEWITSKVDEIALSTWQRYNGIIKKHLLPVFGSITLEDISADMIHKYFEQEKIAKKLSGTSLRQHFVVIESVLKREGFHVMYGMKRPKKNDSTINCIKDPFELKAFVESFANSILFLPVYMAANTGMRLSEIAALRWSDVDLRNGYISVSKGLHWARNENGERYYYEKELKTKNAKRTIKISNNAINVLRTAKTKQNALQADFVCTDTRRNPIGKEQIGKNFSDQAKRQGYNISFHSLRHSHATILILIYKVPPNTVSRRLGHSDITVTLSIYTNVIQELDELAAAAMEQIFVSENSILDENDTAIDTATDIQV